jgi:hypothetical protein
MPLNALYPDSVINSLRTKGFPEQGSNGREQGKKGYRDGRSRYGQRLGRLTDTRPGSRVKRKLNLLSRPAPRYPTSKAYLQIQPVNHAELGRFLPQRVQEIARFDAGITQAMFRQLR